MRDDITGKEIYGIPKVLFVSALTTIAFISILFLSKK